MPDHRVVQWDAKNLGSWCSELKDADILINLTGKSIQCRFTDQNKIDLVTSRVDATMVLGKALMEKEHKIHTWFNASGSAIYPQSRDTPMDEQVTESGKGFLAELSEIWEKAFFHHSLKVRRIALRIAPVLDAQEGAFIPIKRLAKLGLGGAQGPGNQMMSWIHQADFCAAVLHIINKKDIQGPVNMCSPSPVPNREFMRITCKAVGMPIGLPAPSFLIKIGSRIAGVDPSLVMDSQYLSPRKLLKSGFDFHYPELDGALNEIIRSA